MKTLLNLIISAGLLLLSQCLYSQYVVSSAGASATSTTAQLSWTIGEPVIETYTGTGTVLTQGFHQSRLVVTAVDQISLPGISLSVYPNPVTDDLTLDIVGHRIDKLGYQLFDISGRLLFSKKIEKEPETVSMSSFPVGTYLLKVTDNNAGLVQVFKIVKN
jgi:hypothetical protein